MFPDRSKIASNGLSAFNRKKASTNRWAQHCYVDPDVQTGLFP
jgi:hypothetical protein